MGFVIGTGQWILAKPKILWRDDPPFVSMSIDFNRMAGQAEQGTGIGRAPIVSPFTELAVISPSKFRAKYTFGKNSGTMEAEMDERRRLDLTFTGTVNTSCMAEPISTDAPLALVQALDRLDADTRHFLDVCVNDQRVRDDYKAGIEKYRRHVRSDVRKGKVSVDVAVREINSLSRAIGSSVVAGSLLPRLQAAAAKAGEIGGHRWGAKGTMTAGEAFGNPNISDQAWVHFAPSQAQGSIKTSGVTTTTHSSWARWGEVKNLKYGDLVFRIGPMAQSSESDLGIMAIAAEGANIREVKGLYGFRVEGEAKVTIDVSVVESTYVKALKTAEEAAGVTLTELEEAYAFKLFADTLKGRPAPKPGMRAFERLTATEKARVRLEIIEAASPSASPQPVVSTKWGKIGRCLLVISIGISIYKVVVAEEKLKQASREAVGFAGGAGAGFAAGSTVSALAPEAAPLVIGAAVVIGGLLGAMGADFVFEWVDQMTTEETGQNF